MTTLISLVAIVRAPHRAAPIDFGPIRGLPTLRQLSTANGLATGLHASGVLIGIVVIAYTARTIAGDYEHGLIRLWLTHQPSRTAHLTGLLAALSMFTAIAYTATAILTIPISIGLARWQHIETATWLTTQGIRNLAATWLVEFAALMILLSIGAAFAIVLRSASLTITIITTKLVSELIITSSWPAAERFLPLTTISNLAAGGSKQQTLGRSAVLAISYFVVAIITAYTTLNSRDITE